MGSGFETYNLGLEFWDLKWGSGFETYNLGLDFWDLKLGYEFETYNLGLDFWDLKLGYEFETYIWDLKLRPQFWELKIWDVNVGTLLAASSSPERQKTEREAGKTTTNNKTKQRWCQTQETVPLSLSLRHHTLLLLPLPLSSLACALAPRVCLLFSSSLLCFFSSSCFSPKSQQGRETLTGAPVASISLCSCRTCAFPAVGSGES